MIHLLSNLISYIIVAFFAGQHHGLSNIQLLLSSFMQQKYIFLKLICLIQYGQECFTINFISTIFEIDILRSFVLYYISFCFRSKSNNSLSTANPIVISYCNTIMNSNANDCQSMDSSGYLDVQIIDDIIPFHFLVVIFRLTSHSRKYRARRRNVEIENYNVIVEDFANKVSIHKRLLNQ